MVCTMCTVYAVCIVSMVWSTPHNYANKYHANQTIHTISQWLTIADELPKHSNCNNLETITAIRKKQYLLPKS